MRTSTMGEWIMRTGTFALSAGLLAAFSGIVLANPVGEEMGGDWLPLCSQEGFTADVNGMLYTASVSDHFFVRIRVSGPEGSYVDLRDYWSLLRPIQWSASDEPDLYLIDILSQMPPELTDGYVAEILAARDAGELVKMPAEGFLEYYADFNYGSWVDIRDLSEAWLHLAVGGWVTAVDGEQVVVVASEDTFTFNNIPLPALFSEVPEGAVIAVDSDLGAVIREY